MCKLAIAVLFTVAACSSKPKPTPTTKTPPPSGDQHDACSTNDDCVAVEIECCDHCNGGKAIAVNKAHAAGHAAKGCDNTVCTQLACGAATASCEAGKCKLSIGTIE